MSQYFLMHKNNVCGSLEIDDETGRLEAYKDHNTGKSPFLGHADTRLMKKWWDARAVPASRKMMQEVLKQNNCINTEVYLAKNLALSMTDTYWICPVNTELKYEDIKMSSYLSYNNGKIPYHNATSYDFNASLGGQMEKYWDLNTVTPTLVKESYKYYGQQAINELFASNIHKLQYANIPFVDYSAIKTKDNGVICKCEAFTNDKIELVSAYEVIEGSKTLNDQSYYENYIQICTNLGINESVIRDFMDYQTLTDFIISNTDEHLMNFGILRDADTFEYIGPAPIFDSGNSMFYSDNAIILSRAALLEREITAFYKYEEKMLKNVTNKNIVDPSLLPTKKDVIDLYTKAGLPENKALVIAQNYNTKIDMVKDFQKGLSISRYHEKAKLKKQSQEMTFSMICGIPGSGKTNVSMQLIADFNNKGYKEISSDSLYSIEEAYKDTELIIDNNMAFTPGASPQKAFTYISANNIRDEINNYNNDDLVFYIVDKRITEALNKGISVIYEATNLDKQTRQHYIELSGDIEKKLYLTNADYNQIDVNIPKERMYQLAYRLYSCIPDEKEGWNSVDEIGERPEEFINAIVQENDIIGIDPADDN